MKAKLSVSSSGKSFGIALEPETEDEVYLIKELTGSKFTFQFSGYDYMEKAIRFNGYVPSSSND